MPLGTLDRTPPPFFRQGPSALTKLFVLSALALFLMVADTRFAFMVPIRAGVATTLLPVQRVLAVPVDMVRGGGDYLQGLQHAVDSERAAREQLARQSEQAGRAEALAAENARLRALLDLRPALQTRAMAAEVMFEARDPYSRKIFIDRGGAQGVHLGSPVIHEGGVLGQVTRLYPLSAEVTLLTDKEAAIPVLNRRTQQRGSAFGGMLGPQGDGMELRFVSANVDVAEGDLLETSGIDGIYPPGLPVARVLSVERRVESGFARVMLAPTALADGAQHVLVLEPVELQRPPRPSASASAAAPAASGADR